MLEFCLAAHSKNFVMLACTILIGLQGVMDRQIDALMIAKTYRSITCCCM